MSYLIVLVALWAAQVLPFHRCICFLGFFSVCVWPSLSPGFLCVSSHISTHAATDNQTMDVCDRSTSRPTATRVVNRRIPTARQRIVVVLEFAVGGISATFHTAAAPTCNVCTKAAPFHLCARRRRPRVPSAASMAGRIAIRPTKAALANAAVRFTRRLFAALPPLKPRACGHRLGAALPARPAPVAAVSPTAVSRALQWARFSCWCAVALPTVAGRYPHVGVWVGGGIVVGVVEFAS
jgi:hypothetical protein